MNARAPVRVFRPWTLGELRLARALASDCALSWQEIATRLAETYSPARTPDGIAVKLQQDFPRLSKRRWTKSEIQILRSADRQQAPLAEVLQRLDRTAESCIYQARRLRLSRAFVWKAENLRASLAARQALAS